MYRKYVFSRPGNFGFSRHVLVSDMPHLRDSRGFSLLLRGKNLRFYGKAVRACYDETSEYFSPNSMQGSSSWEADSCSAFQGIACLLWNPKVPEHKNLPLDPVFASPHLHVMSPIFSAVLSSCLRDLHVAILYFTKSTFRNVVYFPKIFYRTKFQDSVLSGSSVASTAGVRSHGRYITIINVSGN